MEFQGDTEMTIFKLLVDTKFNERREVEFEGRLVRSATDKTGMIRVEYEIQGRRIFHIAESDRYRLVELAEAEVDLPLSDPSFLIRPEPNRVLKLEEALALSI
jgi:hypothetical protein